MTVLESKSIPRIGAGEATAPNLHKTFFVFLGLSEDEWMRECNASYKMRIKFVNWRTAGRGESAPRQLGSGSGHFYHLFGLLPTQGGLTERAVRLNLLSRASSHGRETRPRGMPTGPGGPTTPGTSTPSSSPTSSADSPRRNRVRSGSRER
ncbi:tryptophan 7-halogenase [Streptomyces niphimycinicus]|uniref:tryptophan 7-halogenase n=1 Tax=Streptomyces niphimycinicus TaxID=2842201 RepID=UPI00209B8271|nr:tryptophan 7-halogenase [Streptomyces niphimycinicus]